MIKKFLNYLQDVRVEMTKVTWPGREDLLASTTVVIIVSLAFAVYIFAVDRVLNVLLGFILSLK